MPTRALLTSAVFVTALLLGRFTQHPPSTEAKGEAPQADASAPSDATRPWDCGERVAQLDDEHARLQQAVETACLQLRMQVASRERREGPVQPWPQDADPRLLPEPFESLVVDAVAETSLYGRLELDCEEFPCLVAVTFDTVEGSGSSAKHLEPLWDALSSRGLDLRRSASAGPWPRQHGVFALLPDGASEALTMRTNFRVRRMLERRTKSLDEEEQ